MALPALPTYEVERERAGGYNRPMRRCWTVVGVLVAFGAGCGWRGGPAIPDDAVRIMPLGDSITQGAHKHESYRRDLWKRLDEAGHRVNFVGSLSKQKFGGDADDYDPDHEGHWGWAADHVLAKLPLWAAEAKPDIVLIHIGTNDLTAGQDLEETVDEIEAIIAVLRKQNPAVVILLAQIIPGGHPKLFNDVRQFNGRLVERAAALQSTASPIVMVDQYSGSAWRMDTYDGLHPSVRGARKMAGRWFQALLPVLDEMRAGVGAEGR